MLELINYNMKGKPRVPIIGVKMTASGGNGGTWININEKNEPKTFDFSLLPNFNWTDELIDGQHMVRIPKFYIKNTNHSEIYISQDKFPGSHCHPAFIDNGKEKECFWFGKYPGGIQSDKMTSNSTIKTGNLTREQCRTYANNRNVNGVHGFHLLNFYELSVLKILFLIEYKTARTRSITSAQINYKNIVNLFTANWTMCDGIYSEPNGRYYVTKNDGSGVYIDTGFSSSILSQQIKNGIVKMKSGSVAGFDFGDVFIAESLTTDTAKMTYPDRYSVMGRNKTVFHFGNNVYGLFCSLMEGDLNYTRSDINPRLCKI